MYAIIPRDRCKSFLFSGYGISLIADILDGSGDIPSEDNLWPKNIMSVAPNIHLLLFNFSVSCLK